MGNVLSSICIIYLLWRASEVLHGPNEELEHTDPVQQHISENPAEIVTTELTDNLDSQQPSQFQGQIREEADSGAVFQASLESIASQDQVQHIQAENDAETHMPNAHARQSMLNNAHHFSIQGTKIYCVGGNLIMTQTPDLEGIVENSRVLTCQDVPPDREIHRGRGYRLYSSRHEGRVIAVKLYENIRAKERSLATAKFLNQRVMHPNVLHLYGVSPQNSALSFLVFTGDYEAVVESRIALALGEDLNTSFILGLQTVAGLSSGLHYLGILNFSFTFAALDHFSLLLTREGKVVISYDPDVLVESEEPDQRSGASDWVDWELGIFHKLCQRTFENACEAHYKQGQQVQRAYIDEDDQSEGRSSEAKQRLGGSESSLQSRHSAPILNASNTLPANSVPSSRMSPDPSHESQTTARESVPIGYRRELVWKPQRHEMTSLEDISHRYQCILLTSPTPFALDRRRGRYTRKTAHRCPGYTRIEITLTTDIMRNAIVSNSTPSPHEICPVCHEIVKDAEIFNCICGRDEDDSIPTIQCSTCSEWHHRQCVGTLESESRNILCPRCQATSPILFDGKVSTPVTAHRPKLGFEMLVNRVSPGALHNSGEVSDPPKCHPNTRVTILEHLTSWAALLVYTYPIMWLHGPAGSGKSAFLRTMAEMLHFHDLLIASFFFFRPSPQRNSTDYFISTIAYQLALSIPPTRPYIEEAIEKNPLIFSLSLWDQAQTLIVSPILAAHEDASFDWYRYPRVIIIDGLDECDGHDKQSGVLDVLCRILQNLPVPLAVLIASRPEHQIRAAFDIGGPNRLSTRLALDDSDFPDTDIRRFLENKFNEIRQNHVGLGILSQWPTNQVIDKLVATASGQFIYASTVIRFVGSPRYNPAKRLEIILGVLNAGPSKPFEQLDTLYSLIFSTIDECDLVPVLRILVCLLAPSNDMAFAKVARTPAFLEEHLHLKTGEVRRLLSVLESLLFLRGDTDPVKLLHTSLSHYLFDKSRSGRFWIGAQLLAAT